MHRSLTVRFDPSRTVVGGPNEAGKSTLVEAIHRALFVRHKSTVGLDRIRPRDGQGPPEVTVEFEAGGRVYTIRKVFKGAQGSVAVLVDDTGREVAGDEAEARLRELLQVGEVTPQRALEQWSHLWVWQGTAGEDPTSQKVLTAAGASLRQRLTGLAGGGALESARDAATYRRIVAEYAETFTATGGVRVGSELGKAEADLQAARQAALDAAGRLASLETAADAVSREEDVIRSRREILTAATVKLDEARRQLAQVEKLEQAVERQRSASKAAAQDYATLAGGDAEIAALDRALVELGESLAPAEEEIGRLVAHERRLQDAATDAAAALTRAVERQQAVTAERDLLEAVEKAFALEAIQKELEGKCQRVEALTTQVAKLEGLLRELPEVDQDTVDELDDLDRQQDVARGTLAAIATRIEVVRADATVTIDGAAVAAGAETTLVEAAELVVGGKTTIRIAPGGGRSLEDVRASITDIEALLRSRLTQLRVTSAAAARRAFDDRTAAASLRSQHLATIEALGGTAIADQLRDAAAHRLAIEAEIDRLSTPGFERPATPASLETARDGADDRARQITRELRDASTAHDDAALAAASGRDCRQQAESLAATRRGDLQRLQGQKRTLEALYGSDREEELKRRADLKRRAEEETAETERALAALGPAEVRADVERLSRTVDVTNREIAAARERQAEARGQLQHAGTVDLHGAKAAAEARLELALARHAEVRRRAEAIRQLRGLFDARRQALAEAFAEPLRDRVAGYLDAVYGAGSRVSVVMTDDGFSELKVTRSAVGDRAFGFDELSGGTKEQVAAACRLAMAELLAGDGGAAGGAAVTGCLPVVFDDAFANADPERIEAVQRLLDLGARRGLQVIVLSCNPDDYGLLGASRVDLRRQPDATTAAPETSGEPGTPGITDAP
jgi:energy-coupling factor transporter ATP-binding protein EcfA2